MANTFLDNMKTIKNSQKSLPEQVADQIRALIIEQKLAIGSRLPSEFELAELLNVGRGTVREAVKLLVARNVLEIQRGKGTFIAHNTGVIDDPFGFAYMEDEERLARELFEIRMQLEPWAAARAALEATEEQRQTLRRCQLDVENLLDEGQNYLPADQQFHINIANCTSNRVLPILIPVITYSVHLFGLMNRKKRKDETIETHRRIVDAIMAHDSEAARQAMIEHLKLNIETVPALNKTSSGKE